MASEAEASGDEVMRKSCAAWSQPSESGPRQPSPEDAHFTEARRRSALLMPSSGTQTVMMGMRTFCVGPIH